MMQQAIKLLKLHKFVKAAVFCQQMLIADKTFIVKCCGAWLLALMKEQGISHPIFTSFVATNCKNKHAQTSLTIRCIAAVGRILFAFISRYVSDNTIHYHDPIRFTEFPPPPFWNLEFSGKFHM